MFLRTSLAIALAPLFLFAQQASFTAIPKQCQLYPRDSHDSAIVPIAGTTTTIGLDSASVTVYKNGAPVRKYAQALSYSSNTASISLAPKIHAELANYKFEIRLGNSLVATKDSVVCGDAYYIEGQSNATAMGSWNGSNPWVRTFGTAACSNSGATPEDVTSDTVWGVGQCVTNNVTTAGGHFSVGIWGMQLGKLIAENKDIPVCIINAAMGGTYITNHLRNTSLGSIYGNGLWRVTQAGLLGKLKAFFWFQGENESADSAAYGIGYKANFYTLYESWKSDFGPVPRVYLLQVRPGNCYLQHADVVAEQQRTIPVGHPEISLMSTTAVPGWDGCHYDTTGYKDIGSRVYGLLARDTYGSPGVDGLAPADIVGAYFSDVNHTRLVLQFSAAVAQPATQEMKSTFSLNGAAGLVDSVKADPAAMTVTLQVHGAADAERVSYLAGGVGSYTGPWLVNTRGIGNLMFKDFPIASGPTSNAERFRNGKILSVNKYSNALISDAILCNVKGEKIGSSQSAIAPQMVIRKAR